MTSQKKNTVQEPSVNPKVHLAGQQPIFEELQAAILRTEQIPDLIAGKSTAIVRRSLKHFMDILVEYYWQQNGEECCESATRVWLWIPTDHTIEILDNSGQWLFPRVVGPLHPGLDHRGGYLCLLTAPTIFRLASQYDQITVDIRPLDKLDFGSTCMSFSFVPTVVYIYEGGVTIRAKPNLYLVEDCTIYTHNWGYGQMSDFKTDDADWYDVYIEAINPLTSEFNPIGDYEIDLLQGDQTSKGGLKAASELLGLSPYSLLTWGLIDKNILEEIFKLPLRTTDAGLSMAERFIAGTGGTMIHGNDSSISQKIKKSDGFETLIGWTKTSLANRINKYEGFVDSLTLQLSSDELEPPRLSWGFGDLELGWPIGGTQGLDIHIIRLLVNPTTRSFEAKLKFVIYDDFGVGDDDRYFPSLNAFWLLQHVKQFDVERYQPFVNQIEVEYSFQATY